MPPPFGEIAWRHRDGGSKEAIQRGAGSFACAGVFWQDGYRSPQRTGLVHPRRDAMAVFMVGTHPLCGRG